MIEWHQFCTIDLQILKNLEEILLTHTKIFDIISASKLNKLKRKNMKNYIEYNEWLDENYLSAEYPTDEEMEMLKEYYKNDDYKNEQLPF